MSTLLGLCGSLRKGSHNLKLVHEAARLHGGALTMGDLRLPLYDGDLEEAEGIPEPVARLAAQIAEADAVIISTPEYNKLLSGVLKNALDWVSRTPGKPWAGKPVAIMSATAGRAGGERTQWSLRLALMPFRPEIVPGPEMLLAGAGKEFDAEGRLTSEHYRKTLTELMEALKARTPGR
ncbi:NADPH-dependent FMN reductase [Jannaschia seohaensis]|uniref:Chromate reductase n=1 Tax=Jannaschia seohaensis TaxID=475081 RepID=A0A2Y9BW78_9RHOB|nr:NAD(P)H-dependent oxidoreductase [Jannaschia seohaensis]PWJ22354.1 chromate reductase [Jannaschia seohaensis]SSA38632.1 chromate reductase [Jannaschia seohaensis]